MQINIKLIEQLRKEKGYRREYIAKCLGYKTVGAYTHKVNDIRPFTVQDLIKLSTLYDIDLKELFI